MKSSAVSLGNGQKISILLEEYRALYSLLQWRLTAADRRLLASAALLGGVLTGIRTLDATTSLLLLWGLPVLLWVLFSVTVGHARSKEDLLRRIDEIERSVNVIAGTDLLVFQSSRPSHEKAVGGRTGMLAIHGTLALCILVLLSCVLLIRGDEASHLPLQLGHGIWAALWALRMLHVAMELHQYRYQRPSLFRDDS